MMAVFDDLVISGKAISKVLTSGILPAKIELMDRSSIITVENYRPLGLPVDAEAILLIQLDGHEETLNKEIEETNRIVREVGARER